VSSNLLGKVDQPCDAPMLVIAGTQCPKRAIEIARANLVVTDAQQHAVDPVTLVLLLFWKRSRWLPEERTELPDGRLPVYRWQEEPRRPGMCRRPAAARNR
jgi:hypothetical protein